MITKKVRSLVVLWSVLAMMLSSVSAFAMYAETAIEAANSVVNSLTLKVNNGSAVWSVDGYSSKGYKVVWSKNAAPTYPTREGDKYHYISDPATMTSSLDAFDGAGEYHVRVCEYLGGKCGKYSNEVVVNLGDEVSEHELTAIGHVEDTLSDAVESLSLNVNNGKATWTVNGYSKKGYKVVWSKNAAPTYPTREGDKYHYISDPATMTSSLDAFDGAGEYHVRVCEYLGGKCGKYSNEVVVNLGDEVSEHEVTATEVVKTSLVGKDFKDVSNGHKNFRAISYLKDKGVVRGQGSTMKFEPESKVNRAEFLKIVLEAKGVELEPAAHCFSDIKVEDWFAPYVCTAKTMGLIKGYGDGTYKPWRDINLAESSKIIVNAFVLPTVASDDDIWYEKFVKALDSYSAIPTTVDAFDHKMTRGEMAEMVWRIDADIKGESATSYEKLRNRTGQVITDGKVDDAVESLSLNVNNGKATWTVNGYSKKGYKVVWSKNAAPTYPTREGDKYHYISDPATMTSSLDAFDGAGEYHVRVCEYLGGKCGKYSNEVVVTLE